jgi:hypothetical protein
MLDARLNIYAQVGDTAVTVISGETSDDFLLASGLITTTGRLTVAGSHPASIGTLVRLSWVRGTLVGRMPRSRLRVLRCTVDPIRRQTEYELGDLFALKAGIRATDPLGLAKPTSTTEQTYDADTLVREAMKKALGSDPGSTGISGKVWGDFDWKQGYLAGAGEILLSFGRFAYLQPDETVAFGSLGSPSLSGPEVDLDDLIDLKPLTGGAPPGAIAIGAGQVRTLASSGGGGGSQGSTSLNPATLTVPDISWSVSVIEYAADRFAVQSEYNQNDQAVPYQVQSTTVSSSDGTVSGSITQTWDLVGAIGVGYISEIQNYLYNLAVAQAQRQVDALNRGAIAKASVSPAPVTGNNQTRELPRQTGTVTDSRQPGLVSVVPNAAPTARVLRTIETGSEVRNADGSGGSVRRTYITRYEADLAIAQSRQQGQDIAAGSLSLVESSLACDFLASTTTTTTTRSGALTVTRTTNWDFRSGTSTNVSWSRAADGMGGTTDPGVGTNYTTTLYRAKVGQAEDNYLESEQVYVCPCTIVDSAEAAYQTFGATQNRLAYGFRHGKQLTSVIGVLPVTPGAAFHLTTDGQTGTFRVNGFSCAFDSRECLVSMDALYWGASA